MTLLLNGCSFGWAWQSFPGTNLSQSGGSIARSVRLHGNGLLLTANLTMFLFH